MGDGNKQMGI